MEWLYLEMHGNQITNNLAFTSLNIKGKSIKEKEDILKKWFKKHLCDLVKNTEYKENLFFLHDDRFICNAFILGDTPISACIMPLNTSHRFLSDNDVEAN